MLFDKLCGIVERPEQLLGPERGRPLPRDVVDALRVVRGIVAEAKVFEFPIVPHEVQCHPKVVAENPALLDELFFLPFKTIAVEDKASCVILQDLVPNASGISSPRFFLEILPLTADPSSFGRHTPPELVQAAAEITGPDAMGVAWGTLKSVSVLDAEKINMHFNFECGGGVLASKRQVFVHNLGDEALDSIKTVIKNLKVTLEQVAYFNMPSRWIVETRGPSSEERPEKGRLARSLQRPRFTTLTPGEIRKLFGGELEEERESPAPHPRRRHVRTFRSERFAKSGLQGKSILIPATWVGPTETEVGNKKYIVRTDL